MEWLIAAVQGGTASLAAYLAAHVLLCLVPAFFIAGALSVLVPPQSIIRFLGPDAPKWVSYPAAAGAGSLLAVCSCTIQPLFAGIYKKGAGLGPAVTFLYFAPAANILALAYTGVALGAEFAIARIVLALTFGVGIGMIMAFLFRRSDLERLGDSKAFEAGEGISRNTLLLLGALVALLIAGTLKVDFPDGEPHQRGLAVARRSRGTGFSRPLGAGRRSHRRRRAQPPGSDPDRPARAHRHRGLARPGADRRRFQSPDGRSPDADGGHAGVS